MSDIKTVTATEFLELVKSERKFESIHFTETLALYNLPHEVLFENCSFTGVDFMCESAHKVLEFKNCSIFAHNGAGLYAVHFLEGVRFIGCTFIGQHDFGCGGHNQTPHEFRIENCIFQEFVSFSDCMFEGPVTIIGNHFQQGTDLLGDKGTPVEVWFDVPPVIEGNTGKLDMSSYEVRWT